MEEEIVELPSSSTRANKKLSDIVRVGVNISAEFFSGDFCRPVISAVKNRWSVYCIRGFQLHS